jgi:hypothetical protein
MDAAYDECDNSNQDVIEYLKVLQTEKHVPENNFADTSDELESRNRRKSTLLAVRNCLDIGRSDPS